MVHRTRPTVKSGRLYQLEREGDPIDVGTPPWYDWLEEHDSFLFVDHVGAVTVRKNETGHGESEWRASRTRLGKVFTVSLGPSRAINLSSLQIAARRLTRQRAARLCALACRRLANGLSRGVWGHSRLAQGTAYPAA